MTVTIINRKQLKHDTKHLLSETHVSPKAMLALYLGISLMLDFLGQFAAQSGLTATFLSILTSLLLLVLNAGFVLYCMAILRGERSEFLTLFDGFSFAGKIIVLHILQYIFVFLWSLLFVIPGIVAAYRYRFALYNLCENPGISAMEALELSKRQTTGYKTQLFFLDLSYMGWAMLAALPSYFYLSIHSRQLLEESVSAFGGVVGTLAAGSAEVSLLLLPVWGWTLVSGLWNLLVGMFYLPNYQCVELGYFEIAKDTSGVKADSAHGDFHSPDNMGNF